ncbi:RidA family protein [Hyphomonas sp. ND6WE1B]|uniref:RidA family protein n=1 Tax=Hyphomonas sp. ND6WE1B TaxID=1848191 RepID=UPI0008076F5A|nr:RidA family protein [Hyphomonas sp. ND6WE1B]
MTNIYKYGVSDRMSQIAVCGDFAWLSGQIASESRSGDIQAQTLEVLDSIDKLLVRIGRDRSHLVSATIWLASMQDFADMNHVWVDWLGSAVPPARATVQAGLAFPDLKVEIQVVVAMKADAPD